MSDETMAELILSLSQLPAETEWLEFKTGNSSPESIARDISALANAATYYQRDCAYKIWGIDDSTHGLVGTDFHPLSQTVGGGQLLPIWLRQVLSSNTNYEFRETHHQGKVFVILEVQAAVQQPSTYNGVAYIREGSSSTRLKPGSQRESELWRRLQARDFEGLAAKKDVSAREIPELLSIERYYETLSRRQPSTLDEVIGDFQLQGLVARQDNGRYTVTNLGALLIGRALSAFPILAKCQLRIVRFEGNSHLNILQDRFFDCGYALALPQAEEHIMAITPAQERLDGMFRRVDTMFPRAAVRELLANTVIHQELSDAHRYPEVHIFDDRLEFTNPGGILVPEDRLLNALPKTRNNQLVGALRLMDICEEEGTGWDIVIAACEEAHLLPPEVRSSDEGGTEITLFGTGTFERMTKAQRQSAAYWHACLLFAQRSSMNNQSLRARFGLDDSKRSRLAVSRLIRECCDAELIKEEDPDAGNRYRRYIPFWA